nr:amino acid adenylation domain-containing protein [Legionella jordanis]
MSADLLQEAYEFHQSNLEQNLALHPIYQTLNDVVDYQSLLQPEKIVYRFLVDEDRAESLTARELQRQVKKLAHYLSKYVVKGDRIIVAAKPGLEFIISFYACLRVGAIAVPIFPPANAMMATRFLHVFNNAKPKLILADPQTARLMKKGLVANRFLHHRIQHYLGISEALSAVFQAIKKSKTPIVSTEVRSEYSGEHFPCPLVKPEDIAFLQYTSGSTGHPRGVMLSHANLLSNLAIIHQAVNFTSESHTFSWLPPYHDMGLIGCILEPLYAGTVATLMSPVDFISKPSRWVKHLSDYQCTISGAPNFAFELCARKTPESLIRKLDLSSIRAIANGAEPISFKAMQFFYDSFKVAGLKRGVILPCYGLAESTLMVSAKPFSKEENIITVDTHRLKDNIVERISNQEGGLQLVSSGVPQMLVRVINPKTHALCKEDEVGEIWVAGRSVATGYYNQHEESTSIFKAQVPEQENRHYLRTGDLGFLHEGELFVCGRLKNLIIINGQNYYPHDFEQAAAYSHHAVRKGCVVAYSELVHGKEALHIVAEIKAGTASKSYGEIVQNILSEISNQFHLSPYQVLLVPPKAIPKTTSGKLQRIKCQEEITEKIIVPLHIYQSNDSAPEESKFSEQARQAASTDEGIETDWWGILKQSKPKHREAKLCELIVGLSRQLLNVPPEHPIDVDSGLFTLGIDSLSAVELQCGIQSALGGRIQLDPALAFNHPTIRKLSRFLLSQLSFQQDELSKSEVETGMQLSGKITAYPRNDKGIYPASYAQKRLHYIHHYEGSGAINYNIPVVLDIKGKLNIQRLQDSLNVLIEQHAMFRTSWLFDAEGLQQVIQPQLKVTITSRQMSRGMALQDMQMQLSQSFDLQRAPAFRALVYQYEPEAYLLFFNFHHILIDFWSCNRIFLPELFKIYDDLLQKNSSELKSPKLEYIDYALWQKQAFESGAMDRQKQFWREKLSDLNPAQLPTQAGPFIKGNPVGSIQQHLSPELCEAIYKTTQQHNVSLFIFFNTVLSFLIWKYSDQKDILVASPASNRHHQGLEEIIGFFVNTIITRHQVNETFHAHDWLAHCRKNCLEALQNQDLPFDEVLKIISRNQDNHRHSMFQVMLVLQKLGSLEKIDVAQINSIEWLDIEESARTDLTLKINLLDNKIALNFCYSKKLFQEQFIEQFSRHFVRALEAFCSEGNPLLTDIELLAEEEKTKILHLLQGDVLDYSSDTSLHGKFQQQAQATPKRICVQDERQCLTYEEVDKRSSQMANYLLEQNVPHNAIIAVYMERNVELLVILLGILKAGCVYLPLDLNHPKKRIELILENAKPYRIFTQASFMPLFCAEQTINVEQLWPKLASRDYSHSQALQSRENEIAYIMFTSGSTGQPKGALNTHRGVLNRIQSSQNLCQIGESDRVLHKTTLSFDPSILEIFWPICHGATLIMAPPNAHKNPECLAKVIKQQQITVCYFVPSLLSMILEMAPEHALDSLRYVICGGERLSKVINRQFFQKTKAILYHTYGPSECSISMTVFKCDEDMEKDYVPIGRPILNTRAYIFDSQLKVVPQGVVGELHIAGVAVGKGYLNDLRQTESKFIANPLNPNETLYKSGDLVKLSFEGNIEFVGRKDHQIKLRGNRIELEEIETCILQIPGVNNAVVKAVECHGQQLLVAYYVSAIAAEKIKEELRNRLPDYMIPSLFYSLKAMKLLPSGKVDRVGLPAPDHGLRNGTSATAMQTETEKKVHAIWQSLFAMDSIAPQENFFDLGGHSLLAVKLVYDLNQQLGCHFTVKELYQNPTIRDNALWIEQHGKTKPSLEDRKSTAELKQICPQLQLTPLGDCVDKPFETIFLTGGTGFLGVYLLRDLLQTFPAATIYVLVRADDTATGLKRLQKVAQQYRLKIDLDRVVPVLGDLAEAQFGLEAGEYLEMSKRIDVIVHNGALVNFIDDYQKLAAVNVDGTAEVLKFAALSRHKPVHYISTLSVVPRDVEGNKPKPFFEEGAINSAGFIQGGYAQTKWVAECLVEEAKAQGLRVKVYRPTRIAGDSQTGIGNENDLFYRFIRGCLQLAAVPGVDFNLDLVPIDFISQFVAMEMRLGSGRDSFNLLNSKAIPFKTIVGSMCKYRKVNLLPYEEWLKQISVPEIEGRENYLFPLKDIFPRKERDFYSLVAPRDIDNSNMLATLEQGKPSVNPEINEEVLAAFIEFSMTKI